MKALAVVALAVVPGGCLALGAVLAYRYVQRRRARREVRAEMQRRGAPMPRTEVRA